MIMWSDCRRALRTALVIGALTTGTHAAVAEDKALLTLGAGVFDLVKHRQQEAEGRIEYRFAHGVLGSDGVFRGFKPLLGVMANSAGGVFGYAGLAAPFAFDDGRWEFVPSAGLGAYRRGDGIDLGGTFEFHIGLAVSYAVTRNGRLGLALDHISNANTHRQNPGANSVLVTWSWAFDGP